MHNKGLPNIPAGKCTHHSNRRCRLVNWGPKARSQRDVADASSDALVAGHPRQPPTGVASRSETGRDDNPWKYQNLQKWGPKAVCGQVKKSSMFESSSRQDLFAGKDGPSKPQALSSSGQNMGIWASAVLDSADVSRTLSAFPRHKTTAARCATPMVSPKRTWRTSAASTTHIDDRSTEDLFVKAPHGPTKSKLLPISSDVHKDRTGTTFSSAGRNTSDFVDKINHRRQRDSTHFVRVNKNNGMDGSETTNRGADRGIVIIPYQGDPKDVATLPRSNVFSSTAAVISPAPNHTKVLRGQTLECMSTSALGLPLTPNTLPNTEFSMEFSGGQIPGLSRQDLVARFRPCLLDSCEIFDFALLGCP